MKIADKSYFHGIEFRYHLFTPHVHSNTKYGRICFGLLSHLLEFKVKVAINLKDILFIPGLRIEKNNNHMVFREI